MYFDLLTQAAIVANEKEKQAAKAAAEAKKNTKTPNLPAVDSITSPPASTTSGSDKSSGVTTPVEGRATPTEDRRAYENKLAGYLWSIR